MNTTKGSVLNIKRIQGAFNILATLQLTAYLWPQQAQVKDGAQFDFIVVGGGSAGSVIASRLAEDEQFTVLLIEAGGDPPVESVVPGLLSYSVHSGVDWNYTIVNDGYSLQSYKDHVILTSGKMLGGSSSINYMAYTRGSYYDFDNWARITKDYKWNYDSVLPYFKKSEKLYDLIILDSLDGTYHGIHGKIGVTKNYHEEAVKYLNAFAEAGNDVVLDINGRTPVGYTELSFTIANGVRQSTAFSYLTFKPSNLYVLKNTLVSKIIFDEYKNAVGVEVILENNTTATYKAKKEVIISAGVFRSPQILMLSGIGPKSHLHRNNIEVLSDLPVGRGLQDHASILLVHRMGKTPPPKFIDPTTFPYPLIVGFASLNKSQHYPDYETINFILSEPSALLGLCSFSVSFMDEICQPLYDYSEGRETFLSVHSLLRPKSRGEVLLQNRDVRQQPLIYTGYYSVEEDLENHARYLEDFEKVTNTKVFKSLEAKFLVPKVCGCNDLKVRIEFWKCYALCMMIPGYHYTSTCAMGSVVDSRLNVIGVQRLRVADASVMPKVVGANSNAATIMIAEKAADFIKEDHYWDHENVFNIRDNAWEY